jgi:hypothetical protein
VLEDSGLCAEGYQITLVDQSHVLCRLFTWRNPGKRGPLTVIVIVMLIYQLTNHVRLHRVDWFLSHSLSQSFNHWVSQSHLLGTRHEIRCNRRAILLP